MTSSNGNIFRVTGPLCGEFTGHRWIPPTKASDAKLWCFFDVRLELTVEWTIVGLVICHYDVIVVWRRKVSVRDVDIIQLWSAYSTKELIMICPWYGMVKSVIVRRAGLLWSQQDFEWRWSVPLFKCLTVLEFCFILFDLCFLITFFNFVMNYVPIVTFWIFTYHKIWILSIMFCFIWSYWSIYFLACLEVSRRVVS